jgi:hypothetical protein
MRNQAAVLKMILAVKPRDGLGERHSSSASVATRLHKRYAISSSFSSFVVAPCGPPGTMTYS